MAYLEVLIAGAASFLLGFAWYTALFGKMWQTETGITDEEAGSGMLLTHGLSFIMMCILAFGINFVVNLHPPEEQVFTHGAMHGAMMAAMYCLPAIAINYLYQKKSLKLYLIDGGYVLVFMTLSGGILAALNLG